MKHRQLSKILVATVAATALTAGIGADRAAAWGNAGRHALPTADCQNGNEVYVSAPRMESTTGTYQRVGFYLYLTRWNERTGQWVPYQTHQFVSAEVPPYSQWTTAYGTIPFDAAWRNADGTGYVTDSAFLREPAFVITQRGYYRVWIGLYWLDARGNTTGYLSYWLTHVDMNRKPLAIGASRADDGYCAF
jgi:hypothetical protein